MITIKQMLELGKECGCSDIEQAYSQVMRHYDVLFFIGRDREMRKEYSNPFFGKNYIEQEKTIINKWR
jgi:hypothetical protein